MDASGTMSSRAVARARCARERCAWNGAAERWAWECAIADDARRWDDARAFGMWRRDACGRDVWLGCVFVCGVTDG